MSLRMKVCAAALLLGAGLLPLSAQGQRWSEAQAQQWYKTQPWLVGANYNPATAINELEMWQAESFDPKRIDLELGWAQSIGMNTMRVFLHDLPWQQDAAGFRSRIDTFLTIAQKHGIRPMFVLFDSCWDPAPKLGPQRAPKPGVHNSGWMQSPGSAALKDPARSTRAWKPTSRAWSARLAKIRACSPGTSGTSPTTRTRRATAQWS